jgi:transcriptional regulator with XRE-family HTH domain
MPPNSPMRVPTDVTNDFDGAQRSLNQFVGAQIRERRMRLGMTIADLAQATGLSTSNLSKIETGIVSPSLQSISAIAAAISLPVHQLFQGYDDEGHMIHVPHETGLNVQQAPNGSGMICELLVTSAGQLRGFQPYVVTLENPLENHSSHAYDGTQFVYVLDGTILYSYGRRQIKLLPGDTLIFDASVPHGPLAIEGDQAKFVCVLLDAQVLESVRAARNAKRPFA